MAKSKQKVSINKFNDLIVYNVGRLYVLLNRYLSNVYKGYGLNPAKFNLLMFIKHKGKDKGIPQIRLGDELFISAANVTKLIDGLEKKGWVIRGPLKSDRRVNLIRITDKGSNLLSEAWANHVLSLNNILSGFSLKDKEQFNLFLESFKNDVTKRANYERKEVLERIVK